MCDYLYPDLKSLHDADTRVNPYCQRASQFWVQSTVSAHNSHTCAQHLARFVREITRKAAPFQIGYMGDEKPDGRYSLRKSGDAHYAPDAVIYRLPSSDANGSLVTVKPYSRKGR